MSDFYYCVFCDTIVLSADQLSDHLTQHFVIDPEGDVMKSLVRVEAEFIESTVKYETDLNKSFQLFPKELPKDNVQIVLIGCPACDAIIRCYDLITNKTTDKSICYCGKQTQSESIIECIDCNQSFHTNCVYNSDLQKCLDCLAKDFKISYLKFEKLEDQRRHCYQHLDYYPFVCQFENEFDGKICGQKFYTFNSSQNHLENYHNIGLDERVDICDVLSCYFNYEPIPMIDDLINCRLNSKLSSEVVNTPGVYNNYLKNIGLIDSNLNKVFNTNVENSNHFLNTSESYGKSRSSVGLVKKKPKKCLNLINTRIDYRSLDEKSENSENIIIPIKRGRGRPRKVKTQDITTSDITGLSEEMVANSEEMMSSNEEMEELLSHKQHYSNWFTHTKPTKFPYFPQKDDEVYYIPYGHQLYKNEVQRRGLYNQSNKNFTSRFFPNDVILAKVAKIDFLFKEKRRENTVIRMVYISLRPYDRKYGTIIHVKYHDLAGIPDFLILKEYFEPSLRIDWQIGDEFRSLLDENYWFGVIVGINGSDYCQISMFKKYRIKWYSNNEFEWLSPWDIEPIDPNNTFDKYIPVPVTDADRRLFFISPPEEWPHFNQKRELRRIVKGLKIVLTMDKTIEFSLLDDITESRYREKILYPVDLKTFIARVENNFYRRHSAIKYDIKFLESNIRKLIKSVKKDPDFRFDEQIAKRLKYHTKFVTALCLVFIDTHECKNPYDLYHNIDDYLETHDVKCYSAKRVHLNLVKKNANYLPTRQKRLRKDSFLKSQKTLKLFNALKNTRSLSQPNVSVKRTPKTPKRPKTPSKIQMRTKSETITKPYLKHKTSRVRSHSLPTTKPSFDDNLYSSEEMYTQLERVNFCNGFNRDSNNEELNYSSDVSYSPNAYNYDDSDEDPDFKTTAYHKYKY